MSKFNKRIDKEELFDEFAKATIRKTIGDVPEKLWEDEVIKDRLHTIARVNQKYIKTGPILYMMIWLIEFRHWGKRETFRFMADLIENIGYAGEASAHSIWYDTNRDNPELIEEITEILERQFEKGLEGSGYSAKTIWLENKIDTPEYREELKEKFKKLFEKRSY